MKYNNLQKYVYVSLCMYAYLRDPQRQGAVSASQTHFLEEIKKASTVGNYRRTN